MADETSIWKKEISFRRKPKPTAEAAPDHVLIPPPSEPSGPRAAEPTTPRFEMPADSGEMPPVTAQVAGPSQPGAVPPFVPASALQADEPPPEPTPDSAPPVSAPVPAPALAAVPGGSEQQVPLAVTSSPPSRAERREAKRAADQAAKAQRQRAKALAKKEPKASRHKRTLVVGLKVGSSQIAAAQIMNKGVPRVVRVARAPLPPGVVAGGELRDPEELTTALKTLFRKNKLPKSGVRLGIANDRIGVRTFEISGVEDEKQLANAVRFRAQETLPIPLDEAVLDYRLLDDRVGEDGVRACRVLLVVAHRELVERYVAACRKAGLKLIGIDLEAFGLLRALADPGSLPSDDAAVVCIAIGRDRSTLAVSNGRDCEFTRVLSWGGADLDLALARTLDLAPDAVEPLKHRLALGAGGESAGLDAPQADAARAAILGELRNFARELVGSLRFYQEQPNSLGIAEILVTGGASAADGLAAELERLIGIPVRVADPLARVQLPRELRNQPEAVGSLAVAVGLGIED